MSKMHVKTGDTVMIITGKEKLVKGKVVAAIPKENRVVVEGANMVTRHTKPKRQGEPGGRIDKPAPINASNVMLYCSKCNKGVRFTREDKGGKKVRVCKKCGNQID